MKKLTIKEIKELATDAIMGRVYMAVAQDTLRTRASAILKQLCTGDYIIVRPTRNGNFQTLVWRNGEWI